MVRYSCVDRDRAVYAPAAYQRINCESLIIIAASYKRQTRKLVLLSRDKLYIDI